MRSISARPLSSLIACTGFIVLLSGCGSSSSSQRHAYIPIETIPDHEYTGPLRTSSETRTASANDNVRFNAPAESGRASFQPVSSSPGDDDDTSPFTQSRQTYYYYPSAEVYFSPDRSTYYWQTSANRWASGPQLPRSVRLSESEREMIQLRASEPQRYHSKIKVAYPAGGMLTTVDSDH